MLKRSHLVNDDGIHFKVRRFPLMSLGWALMEGNLRLKDMWDPIVEKFESYLCEQGSIFPWGKGLHCSRLRF